MHARFRTHVHPHDLHSHLAPGRSRPQSTRPLPHRLAPVLADRGSRQALGIVTDVGLFVRNLAGELLDEDA